MIVKLPQQRFNALHSADLFGLDQHRRRSRNRDALCYRDFAAASLVNQRHRIQLFGQGQGFRLALIEEIRNLLKDSAQFNCLNLDPAFVHGPPNRLRPGFRAMRRRPDKKSPERNPRSSNEGLSN